MQFDKNGEDKKLLECIRNNGDKSLKDLKKKADAKDTITLNELIDKLMGKGQNPNKVVTQESLLANEKTETDGTI